MDSTSKRFLAYQWQAAARAWGEAWEWSPVNQKQAIFSVITIALIWYAAAKLGVQEDLTNAIGILGVVVPILVGVGFFLAQRLMAPVRIVSELEGETGRLSSELQRLKTPKLLLDYRDDDTRYRFTENGEERAYIRLYNDTAEDIVRIEVFTNGVIPVENSRDWTVVMPPREVSPRLKLAPGDETFIKILGIYPDRIEREITTIHHSGPARQERWGKIFRMKLVVVAPGLYPAIRRKFTFGIDETGQSARLFVREEVTS